MCSATETSWNLEILHEASVVDILSREGIMKVLTRLHFCCLHATISQVFFYQGPNSH